MRLLHYSDGEFQLTKDLIRDIPRYAILSHTWLPDIEEVTFKDLVDGTGVGKLGYKKIEFCAEQTRRDGLQYFWVDTCCIDKSNNNELSTAIISMFRWYQNASRCYVYLSDILVDESNQQSGSTWEPAFRAHRWFTRGWTLQELLAPTSVEFFAQSGQRLGDKRSLEQQIHEITGIAIPALRGDDLSQFNAGEPFEWARTRQTTQEEDWAYSLLGIFNISMPVLYGEGKTKAVYRLKKEIAETSSHNLPKREAKDPAWMVPFAQNPSFIGRTSEVKTLHQMLFAENRIAKVAITGLGGVGKTQLALELVYQIRAEYNECSIIWIPATSKESLEQAYVNAAKHLGISGCEDGKADVKELVRGHLNSEKAGRWLLVFDNADDVSIWVDKPTPDSSRLIDYLPRSSYGSIIFTTRDKKAAVRLAGRNVVELPEMDKAGGEKLLEKYLIDQDLINQESTTALLARLTYLPLAIVQATFYINANGIGLEDYLSLLDEQEEDVIDLLSEDFEDEGRYGDLMNPVATTWLISFEQIRQRDPLAADYLSFMACVDAKNIPQSLLPPGYSRKKEADAIGTLQAYSFISKQPNDSSNVVGSSINIHRLVYLAMRNWLRKEGLLSGCTDNAIARLAEVMQDIGHNNRAIWRSYMPHAYYVLGSKVASEDNNRLGLLHKYGMCLDYDGRYREAETPFEQVMRTHKKILGADHLKTITSMSWLASTYSKQGRWEEAEELQVQVIEARKTKLGADHPDTLNSMAYLALTYREQGRWEEAEELQVQVMGARKTKLGADYPDTLSSMGNLASTYWEQGRWEEAEELQVQVMEASKMKLGADHPDTLTSMANLASTYGKQGRWEEAEELDVQVIEASKMKLRADHPDTLNIIANLASMYWEQDRWEEAEELQVQVMEARKTKLGANHPDTLSSMRNLAHIWKSRERHEDALELMQACFDLRQQILGGGHPSTQATLSELKVWREENE